MAVTLRLVRMGRKNRAYFRLRAGDSRKPPDARFLEELGTLDPVERDPAKQVTLKKERIEYWLGVGAKTSDTVRQLLTKNGIKVGGKSEAKVAK